MRLVTVLFSCLTLLFSGKAVATTPSVVVSHACDSDQQIFNEHLPAFTCASGRTYDLKYMQKVAQIVLKFDKKMKVLHRIPKRLDPSTVGTDTIIGFLPDALQIYKRSKILMYTSSIRTTGGDGSGQCGSGSEINLNFLDVSAATPKVISKILIGSCQSSIELSDQDISKAKLGALSVVDNMLSLEFVNYGTMEGSLTATVSSDFRRLDFK